jgi:hypothetical protein
LGNSINDWVETCILGELHQHTKRDTTADVP